MTIRRGIRSTFARSTTSIAVMGALLVAACQPAVSPPLDATAPSVTGAPTLAPSEAASPSTGVVDADFGLSMVVDSLVAPLALVTAPDGTDRSFVVDQTGTIHILVGDEVRPVPFLDIADRVVRLDREYDERGLLALAFHPDYATNGRLFVYYGAPTRPEGVAGDDHTNTLSEFRVRPDDPDRVDPASERKILEFEQPQSNHSGGALGFGPDGLLYLGTGDGGGRGDMDDGHSPQGNAQDPDKLNGKVLRLDVDGDPTLAPYAIPDDNPLADGGGRPEIFAFGFRNPWRLSWEPSGGRRLLVSDVGYGRYEELDSVVLGGNYGWRIREGAHCLDLDAPLDDLADCPLVDENGDPLIDPVLEFTHREVGLAIVGGYVYRGGAVPTLVDRYVFANYSADWTTADPRPRGSLLIAEPQPDGVGWPWRQAVLSTEPLTAYVTGMGEDAAGELHVMTRTLTGPTGRSGAILRVVAP